MDELQLVQSTGWILTKRAILQKATDLLALASQKMQPVWEAGKPSSAATLPVANPKISKGEQYLGLPWVMLDYPRYFIKEDTLAIRTLFWWGNFFSIALQVSGRFKNIHQQHILTCLQSGSYNDHYIGVHTDPWQHHFETGNYRLVADCTQEELAQLIVKQSYIKLAVKFPLEQWALLPGLLERSFEKLAGLLQA